MKTFDEEETWVAARQDASEICDLPAQRPEISVFLPVYNEEPNLRPLHVKLNDALKALGRSSEVIYVDDGSTDESLTVLRDLARIDKRVRVIALRRNYGQTAAM